MKLVLANNQSKKFKDFHIAAQNKDLLYKYAGYRTLLFDLGDGSETSQMKFVDTKTGISSDTLSGVYINGYLNTPELASTVATVLQSNGIPFVNQELAEGLSLSKLTGYAKLAAAKVAIPYTYGGTAQALTGAVHDLRLNYPQILKRADADRGIDNFKVTSNEEVEQILSAADKNSLWILQEFIENDGYYLVSFYHSVPKFGIYRKLQKRADANPRKEHMYKPKGGSNASLLTKSQIPKKVLQQTQAAIDALNRQIGSVDALYDSKTGKVQVLEVNYNPQLITIETFKETRVKAFLDAMKGDWSEHVTRNKTVLGESEFIKLPSLSAKKIPARIDTGAESCAIWVSKIKKVGNELRVVFWGEESEYYTNKEIIFTEFNRVAVTSSNGGTEKRYKVELPIVIGGKKYKTKFTLTDRSTQSFPVLIGRQLLASNFIVDVNKGIKK